MIGYMKLMKKKKRRVEIRRSGKIKAVCLLSGGLDSALSAKLVKDQGIEVHCVFFRTPFFASGESYAKKLAERMEMPFETIELSEKYLQILRKPKHGYGSALNPCIDCHVFMLKEAKKYAKKIGARFIITGEVLGQRPKSQQLNELILIEKESGLKGRLLRPLSARLLPKTEAEKYVDNSLFPAISGRSRNEQFHLAKSLGIRNFQSPAGGCLLTHREYAAKVRDLLENEKKINKNDIELLKIGRHFRCGKSKIIVGRNLEENNKLVEMKSSGDYCMEAQDDIPSPITLVRGKAGRKELETAAKLTALYSDANIKIVKINYGKKRMDRQIMTGVPGQEEIEKFRIVWK